MKRWSVSVGQPLSARERSNSGDVGHPPLHGQLSSFGVIATVGKRIDSSFRWRGGLPEPSARPYKSGLIGSRSESWQAGNRLLWDAGIRQVVGLRLAEKPYLQSPYRLGT